MKNQSLALKIKIPLIAIFILSMGISYFGYKTLELVDKEYSNHFQAELLVSSMKSRISRIQNVFHKMRYEKNSFGNTKGNATKLVENLNNDFKLELYQLLNLDSEGVWGVSRLQDHIYNSPYRVDENLVHLQKLVTKINQNYKKNRVKSLQNYLNEFDNNAFLVFDRLKPLETKIKENRVTLNNYQGHLMIALVSYSLVVLCLVYTLIYLPWINEYHQLEREEKRLQGVLLESEIRGNTFSWELNYSTKETRRSNHLSGIFELDDENSQFFLYDEVALLTPECQGPFLEAIDNCVMKDDTMEIEVCLITKNSKKYWLQYYAKKYEIGNEVFVQGTVRDITNTVLSRLRFEALFENLASPALIFGEGQIRSINRAGKKFLGVSEVEDFDNLHPAILFPLYQLDGQSSLEKLKKGQNQAKEGKVIEEDWTFQTRFGKDTVGSVILFNIPYSEIDMYLMIITDNRQKYEFERRLVDANRRALHSRRLKLEYVTHMGLVLQDLTDLVREEIASQKQADLGHWEKLEEVKNKLDLLWKENLTQGLEEGSHIVLTDLRALMDTFSKRWNKVALENDHEFKIHYPQDQEQYIWIDSTKLRLALMTMVDNALSFGENNKIELRVDAKFKAGRFGKITFSVHHSSASWPQEDWKNFVVEKGGQHLETDGNISLNSLLKVIEVLQGEFFIGESRGTEKSSLGFQCTVERAMGTSLEDLENDQLVRISDGRMKISASDIWSHFGGDWDVIEATIKDFVEYYPSALADMHYFLRDKDADGLYNVASDLYGVLAHFPFFVGMERVIKIQKYSKYLKFERIGEEIDFLSFELNDLGQALREYLPEQKNSKQRLAS